ncbi:TIGR04326 family surface carbohydrate biosynthesis protein [Leptospira santarosai]|uniref:TIGR04326 family surface carbohydrate biosynthesis protein n=1 Tax=Leptospira santarosai TaxID=28183 RepID=UPI0002BF3C16|nr:TIGR04326 family surface carbohydrate biosynthesis protein [Leptospira santarosai]EMO70415.1 surface carbohydrate biosynthesis protein, TIGR04326 family [Leptospira santarosai str. 200403458]EMO96823.1 surface carbohydrate biosynthesis protein, TIGR04326 family [Leptospira santarosai str. 200702252]
MFNQSSYQNSILIWDHSVDQNLPHFSGRIYLWRDYSEDPSKDRFSIPKYIDQNRIRLREQYNSILYQLGEIRLTNKRIVDWLQIRPGLSYWWMTLIVESNYGKSSFMTPFIKLLALEEILSNQNVLEIIFSSSNSNLKEIIRKFCKENKIRFSQQNGIKDYNNRINPFWIFYKRLPYIFRASIAFFRYLRLIWGLRKQNTFGKRLKNFQTSIFDYFFHLRFDSKDNVSFESNYWTDLVDVFRNLKIKTLWSHIFIPYSQVPSSKKAISLAQIFNQNENEVHHFLEGQVGFLTILKTILDYIRVYWIYFVIRRLKSFCKTNILAFDFWPLIRNDFLDSLIGPTSVQNLFFLNLIEANLQDLPSQKFGIYLQENQAWEMALIYAWKSKINGPLIGVPHAAVRFWDLRYFRDSRSYIQKSENSWPMPDVVAINGSASWNAYREGKYPEDRMTEVEALRFLKINSKMVAKKNPIITGSKVKVLILTDYVESVTKLQMQMLVNAIPFLNRDYTFILKSHPACPIQEDEFPSLQLMVRHESITDLLEEVDIAYTSNITSAAIDVYCSGVPVVSVLDGTSLNMSPLLGVNDVVFVSTAKELSNALESDFGVLVRKENSLFCIDSNLPKWKKLLAID